MSSTAVDAAVVGAGVIGLTTAWRLRQTGMRVALIDPVPAGAATHAAAGMLAPVSEVTYGETALLTLAMESLRRYPAYVEELEALTGTTVGLRREGTLIVATDAGDRDMLLDLRRFQASLGLSATVLDSRECRRLEPMLAPEVRCGLLVSSDHSVDNRRLAHALLAVIEQQSVELVRNRVAAVSVAGDAVTGVVLAGGDRVEAATVVLAAGPWSGQITGLPAEAQPPVRPVKGEILRLRAHSPELLPRHSVRVLVNGHEVYLVPRADGELVVGATVEEAGFDTTVRAGAVRELLRDARTAMPAVDELELVESLAALRPGTPDNAPMIGATAVGGLHVACGHYRNGILLAPITADLLTAAITGSATDRDHELLAAVAPTRFTATVRA
jgi:glycine oxidase